VASTGLSARDRRSRLRREASTRVAPGRPWWKRTPYLRQDPTDPVGRVAMGEHLYVASQRDVLPGMDDGLADAMDEALG
jgi:hypothetical protein